ncbi:cation-transporting P-type ATPase [Streptomyces caeni]|uniref:Cation-transporting P-type ATPase n=1 Tax=Streptomyces caeni TaxID=2307231 RepID=A0ABW4J4F2_9ACTN
MPTGTGRDDPGRGSAGPGACPERPWRWRGAGSHHRVHGGPPRAGGACHPSARSRGDIPAHAGRRAAHARNERRRGVRGAGTSPRGLTEPEAYARRARYGPNELPRARRRGVGRQLAGQFTDLFAVMLLVASGITFLAYGLQDPVTPGPCSWLWRSSASWC